jgi:quercetin dioxygenase-like cupin family protein
MEQLLASPQWQKGARTSVTLLKHPHLRLVLVALHAGKDIHEHHAPGQVTVQVIRGSIRLAVAGREYAMAAGDLLAIADSTPHDVHAIDDSTFLITIASSD